MLPFGIHTLPFLSEHQKDGRKNAQTPKHYETEEGDSMAVCSCPIKKKKREILLGYCTVIEQEKGIEV